MTADLMSLGSEVSILETVGIRVVHIDVMDGCFCPMMNVGPPVVRAMKTPLLKDVHLMIVAPLDKVADYVAAGADLVTVHPESGPHLHRVVQRLGSMTNAHDPARGLVRGAALNPGTPLEVPEPLMAELELTLLLAVNTGGAGQTGKSLVWQQPSPAPTLTREKPLRCGEPTEPRRHELRPGNHPRSRTPGNYTISDSGR